MLPQSSSRRWPVLSQRTFVLALLALFAVVSVQYTVKALDTRNGRQDRSAILRWRDQLLDLDSGENIYQRYTYPNPPIMALLLRPLAELPPLAGALAWYFLKVGMALYAFAAVFRMVQEPDRPFPPWARALTVLLSLRPILGDLTHGNVNLFILFLVVAALDSYRHRWDELAGILIALAIACKVTPALFVAYFLWKRAWRVLAGCALGLVLFFFAVPAAFLGWEQNLELLTSWVRQMVLPYVVGGVVTSEHQNQSLPGLLFRMLTASPSFIVYVDNVSTPAEYHNVLSLDPLAVRWLVKGCMAAFVGLIVWTCRTPTTPRQGVRLAAEYGLIVLGMLLFSERTWKHHCVTLLIPFAVICYDLAAGQTGRGTRGFLIGVLVAVQLLIAATSTTLLPDDAAKLAQVYGAYVGAFGLLAVALAVVLRSGVAVPTREKRAAVRAKLVRNPDEPVIMMNAQ
jgi:hypothetical protein